MKKYRTLFALITLVLISPIFIFMLFEYGLWMIVCSIIYIAIEALCSGYCLIFFEDNNDRLPKNMSNTDISICTFVSAIGILALVFHFAPLYMTSVDFLNKINYIFGTKYNVFYEGGIFVTNILLWSACIIILPYGKLIKECFKRNKLTTLKGLMYIAIFVGIILLSYKNAILGYNSTERDIQYRRQCDDYSFEVEDSLQRIQNKAMERHLFWKD